MRHHSHGLFVAQGLFFFAISLAGRHVYAQVSVAVLGEFRNSWTGPNTPDGVPDLQGIWTNQTTQPLERPPSLGSKEFYTPDEMAKRANGTVSTKRTSRFGESDAHYDATQFGVDRSQAKTGISNRTSIIVGPEG